MQKILYYHYVKVSFRLYSAYNQAKRTNVVLFFAAFYKVPSDFI